MNSSFLGLALGGGGARGAAHIGVLQVLDESKIRPQFISGTSAGAVIGAMYAGNPDGKWVETRFKEFLLRDDTKLRSVFENLAKRHEETLLYKGTKKIENHYAAIIGPNRSYLFKRDVIDEMLEFLLIKKNFDDLEIPLKVVASDIQTGDDEVYDNGDLLESVARSCSIPGLIKPTNDADKIIVDGGVTNPLPISTLKTDCEFIIGVNIDRNFYPRMKSPNMIEVIKRADFISGSKLTKEIAKGADFVVEPDVRGINWFEYEHFDLILNNGRKAITKELDRLKVAINKKSNVFYKLEQLMK
tara:strand:+ start:63069 stop:63971 length:903 start_codon:yes stop_codon:yes gene_type:complete